MATLGPTGKTDPRRFDGKKKLFLVPLIPMSNAISESNSELLDRYWKEVTQQIGNLESALGTVRHVFHEMVHDESENGLNMLESISPGSVKLVRHLTGSGAKLCQLEDPELLMEMTDWQRCLSVGLISKKVFEMASENYKILSDKRNASIAERINNVINETDVGLLCISEGHTVQFPTDIQVFYVAPPSSNDLRAAVSELMNPTETSED
ncbi:MAG: hypothetical protein VX869_07460 [Chloroflexota bacterium]|nr:hypothetical protein [Chloroflexota bacterium]